MTRPALAAFMALAVVACKGKGDAPAGPAPAPPAAVTPDAPVRDAAARTPSAPAAAPDPAVAAATAALERDARALLSRWLDAQNQGALAAYKALYASTFHGVRRSGSQVARFDHDGWIADRAHMFAYPMVVTAADVSALAHDKVVYLLFTQSFEQGTYHDTGRKVLVVSRGPSGLAIVHEEMLASTTLPASGVAAGASAADGPRPAIAGVVFGLGGAAEPAQLALAIVHDKQILLARTDGDLGADAPEIVDSHTSIDGEERRLAVERSLVGVTLPPALAGAVGLDVELLDVNLSPVCHARVGAPTALRAAGVTDGTFTPEDAAARVWRTTHHIVVAGLDGADRACLDRAAFARAGALPPLEVPEPPAGARARRGEEVLGSADGAVAYFATVVVTEDTCAQTGLHTTHVERARRAGGRFKRDGWIADLDDAPTVVAALDLDGDGAAEVVTTTGVFPPASPADFDAWLPRLEVDWPPGLGCDGQE